METRNEMNLREHIHKKKSKFGHPRSTSPWMSIDVPDVNTIFVQWKSNELQENYTQYSCSTPVEKFKQSPPPSIKQTGKIPGNAQI